MKLKYISTPQELFDHFTTYVEFIKANPIKREDYVGKDANKVERKLEKPLTWVGFEIYLNKNEIICGLGDYERNANNSYTEFVPIIEMIKKIIEEDQFTGAMVGIFNPAITARKLGLADKKEVKHDVYDVTLKLD